MKNISLLAIVLSTVSALHADGTTNSSPTPTTSALPVAKTATMSMAPVAPAAVVIPLKDPVAVVDGVKISKDDLEKAFKN